MTTVTVRETDTSFEALNDDNTHLALVKCVGTKGPLLRVEVSNPNNGRVKMWIDARSVKALASWASETALDMLDTENES